MRLIAPVTTEPVTVTQLAWNLRLISDPAATYTGVDADFLALLIAAAREDAEHYAERHWAARAVAISFNCFSDALLLPRDVISVDAINYIDSDNASQVITLTASDYTTVSQPSGKRKLVLLNSYLAANPLPELADRPNAIEIVCTLGQADVAGAAYVPPTVCQAILMIASHWYENRESVMVVSGGVEAKSIAQSYAWLLDSHKLYGVG